MKTVIALSLGLCFAATLVAHPGHDEDSPVLLAATTPASSPMTNQVSISIEGEFRVIRANGLPDHTPGQFPNRGNPNRIAAQNYIFRVALHAHTNTTMHPENHAL